MTEKRQRQYDLFDNIPSGVAVYEARNNGNDFVFVDFNLAAEKIEGLEREFLIGRSVKDIFPNVEVFGLFKVLQEVWQTGLPQHHPVSHYKDGRIEGWRENYVYRLPGGEVVAVYSDITPTKKKEHTLETRQAQLNTLMNFSDDIFVLKDENGIYKLVNPAFCKFIGMHEHEIVGKTDHDLFPLEEADRYRADDIRIMESGVGVSQDEEVSGRHGQKKWLNVIKLPVENSSKQRLGVFCSVRDVTERKKAEEELSKSEALLQSLFRAAPVGVGLVKDRVIQWANESFCSMLGFSLGELVGKSSRILYETDEEFQRVGALKYPQIYEKGVGEIDTQFRHKDGRLVDIHLQSAPLYPGALGKGVVFTALDISLRIGVERDLQQAHAELEKRVRERTEELEEANIALSVLLKHRGKEKREIEERMVSGMYEFVFPYLEKIQQADSLHLVALYGRTIRKFLEEIVEPFAVDISASGRGLTPREVQVATLVRHGRTTKDIAMIMGLSKRTVETYRDNLRKKFEIKNKNANLRTHLLSVNLSDISLRQNSAS